MSEDHARLMKRLDPPLQGRWIAQALGHKAMTEDEVWGAYLDPDHWHLHPAKDMSESDVVWVGCVNPPWAIADAWIDRQPTGGHALYEVANENNWSQTHTEHRCFYVWAGPCPLADLRPGKKSEGDDEDHEDG